MTWNPFSLGCQAQIDTTFFSFVDNVRPRRFAVVDRERGLVFGLFMFHVSGTVTSYTPPGRETMPALPQNLSPYTIAVAELYKIKNAQIGRIEAMQVNVPYGTPSPFGPTEWRTPKRPVPVLTPSPAKPGPCDRACLEGFVTRYLDAMVAHDPTRLPVAPGVVFTENDVPLRLGEALWRTASGHRELPADALRSGVGQRRVHGHHSRERQGRGAGAAPEGRGGAHRRGRDARPAQREHGREPGEGGSARSAAARNGARGRAAAARHAHRPGQHVLRGDRAGQRRRGAVRRRVQPLRERHPHVGAGVLGAARHAHLRLHPVDPAAALHAWWTRSGRWCSATSCSTIQATSPGSTCRARGGAR